MIWIKPNGTEIEVNDNRETKEYVKSLGWKEKGAKKVEVKEEIPKPVKKKAAKKKAKK